MRPPAAARGPTHTSLCRCTYSSLIFLGRVAHHLTHTYCISSLPRPTRGKIFLKNRRQRKVHGYRIAMFTLSPRTPIASPLCSLHGSTRGRCNVIPRDALCLPPPNLHDLVYRCPCKRLSKRSAYATIPSTANNPPFAFQAFTTGLGLGLVLRLQNRTKGLLAELVKHGKGVLALVRCFRSPALSRQPPTPLPPYLRHYQRQRRLRRKLSLIHI